MCIVCHNTTASTLYCDMLQALKTLQSARLCALAVWNCSPASCHSRAHQALFSFLCNLLPSLQSPSFLIYIFNHSALCSELRESACFYHQGVPPVSHRAVADGVGIDGLPHVQSGRVPRAPDPIGALGLQSCFVWFFFLVQFLKKEYRNKRGFEM